ncbi:MAG: hypothetical protein ACI4PC_04805 [Oscillospiraceae bacterium]
MIRNKFFEDTDGGYAKISVKKIFDRVWKKVLSFEEMTGQSLDNGFTKEQYVSMFNSMRIRHTGIFFNYKSNVMSYVRYLIADGALPEEQESILASVTADDLKINEGGGVQYYKNLGMLHQAIQDSIKASKCYDETLYDLPAAILYLAWYGLTEEQTIDFPKENVLDDGVIINGMKTEMPFEILQVFTRLRDSDGYYQRARGVIFRAYVYSDNLIRTERNSRITLSMLQGLVNRLNALMNGTYSLRYNVIRQSGIFYRAHLLECESTRFDLDDPEFASRVFCEDLSGKAKRTARIRDYKLYKQLFG